MAGLKMALVVALILALSCEPIAALCLSCPKDCCFAVRRGRLRPGSVASYYRTTTDCYLNALVFVMKNGKQICVDPQTAWVKRTIAGLPEKK